MKRLKNGHLLYLFIIYVLMIVNIIRYKPSVFLYIPLLVSVLVMFLQSKVNRYAFLVGGINSILYMISYIKMSLYATAVYSITVSFSLQMITFFNWGRHTEKNKTELRKMTPKTKLAVLLSIVFGILFFYVVFSESNSQYRFFDNCVSVFGIVTSILCMLRFKEYSFLQILGNVISLGMFLVMAKDDPVKVIWVINSVNSLISSALAFKNININMKKKEIVS